MPRAMQSRGNEILSAIKNETLEYHDTGRVRLWFAAFQSRSIPQREQVTNRLVQVSDPGG
jgi:hypothetical protein